MLTQLSSALLQSYPSPSMVLPVFRVVLPTSVTWFRKSPLHRQAKPCLLRFCQVDPHPSRAVLLLGLSTTIRLSLCSPYLTLLDGVAPTLVRLSFPRCGAVSVFLRPPPLPSCVLISLSSVCGYTMPSHKGHQLHTACCSCMLRLGNTMLCILCPHIGGTWVDLC